VFVTKQGELLVNELAPRPHNSYHQSERGCVTSQFEQHVRATVQSAAGRYGADHAGAIVNLLGEVWLERLMRAGLRGSAGRARRAPASL
jgi:5-(carboxyamino)imidazole ribonucleotide synthase